MSAAPAAPRPSPRNHPYYWRVRPLDAAGNTAPGRRSRCGSSPGGGLGQPTLVYPTNDATVGDPFYFQWTPVTLASEYRVQVATSASFASFASCETTHTTFAALGSACAPSAAGTYYWRVLAVDGHSDVVSDVITASVRRFVYMPAQAVLVAPAAGAQVVVPTLKWEPVALAANYKVSVVSLATGATVSSTTTAATSFTPRAILDAGTYRWQVQTVDGKGKVGASFLPDSQRRFVVVDAPAPTATGAVPVADGGTYDRFPTLQWSPSRGPTATRS